MQQSLKKDKEPEIIEEADFILPDLEHGFRAYRIKHGKIVEICPPEPRSCKLINI